jgi:DNA-binding NtrC family response regulator
MTAQHIEVANEHAISVLNKRRAVSRTIQAPIDWLLNSPRTESLVAMAKRFAAVPTTPIVIQSERGCGVHALARLIHDEDPIARAGRFRIVPAQFVSAAEVRGWLHHGTLVIEDVENLQLTGQTWLAETLAARADDRYALRVVATTCLPVGELLERRHLSPELVHALDVFRLRVPPLREYPEELGAVAQCFLKHYGELVGRPFLRLSPEAESKLRAHAYPANVSELRNVIERAVALGGEGIDDIPANAIVFYEHPAAERARDNREKATRSFAGQRGRGFPTLVDVEREYLITLIRELGGRRTEIARAMGVSYQTVLKKISRHQLDVRAILAGVVERGRGG